MSQVLNLQIKGLITNSNNLSQQVIDGGGLNIAKNVVIDSQNQIASRRGFEGIAPFANTLDRADAMTVYQDKVIVRRSNDNKLAHFDGTSTWTDYSGTYSHPDSDYARMKFSQANGNLYFTTSDGVQVLDAIAGPIYSTGMPRGLDGTASNTGASGFMTDNTQVAYRVVWGTRDTSNNLYLGSPSQRILVSNSSGGTRDNSLTFTIPSGITTSDFFQVYRSGMSSSSTTEPNDELQLVYEANPSGAEITAKSITFTDATPDSLKGAYLYTNANQEGIAESNDIPPNAKDIVLFKNFMFYANVTFNQQIGIDLIAVSGSSGLVADDTITINGMVFTAKATTTIASREFKVFTAGSASQNIDDTARELVKVINQYASNTSVYAYYDSGYGDLPGQITIQARTSAASSFTVSVSRSTAWSLDNAGTSQNFEYEHGLMWSKIQQPEHVPVSHLEFIGSKNHPIRRILALRDSLFIFKDDGVYRLTGNNGSWVIEPSDTSTFLIAPESAVVVNNQILGLFNQGICQVSDIGVAIISEPIQDQITRMNGLNYTSLKTLSFGVGYETDRKYILFCPESSADTYPTRAFVYHTLNNTFVEWVKDAKCGVINPVDNKLYIAGPLESRILKERKSFTYTDFIDENLLDVSYSISSFSLTSVILNDVSGITVGDLLYQSSTKYSPIIAIDVATSTVTTYSEITWSIASVSIFKGIDSNIEYINQTCGNASVEKHFQEIQLLFKEANFSTASVSTYTDISGGYSSASINGNYGGGNFGLFEWGSIPWGGLLRPKPVRTFVPREKSRGTILSIKFNIRVGYAQWKINGVSLFFETVSEVVNRD